MNHLSDIAHRPAATDDDRILSREACEALWQQLQSLARGGGRTSFILTSTWNGEIRWARNQIHMATDRRDVQLSVSRVYGSARGICTTNQLDASGVEDVIREAEYYAAKRRANTPKDLSLPPAHQESPRTTIWSDATFDATAPMRGQIANVLSRNAESKGMLAAGYMEVGGRTVSAAGGGNFYNNGTWGGLWHEEQYDPAHDNMLVYHAMTQAQCSMTVRHPKGLGSGWAGASSFDWAAIDAETLADRALEKCMASLNPVRIEPGRYTVILEPQAVASLVELLMSATTAMDRSKPEQKGQGPWILGPDQSLGILRTKLGLRVMDERITLSHDPADPQLGVVPIPGMQPVVWVEHGVLKTLSYIDGYAVLSLKEAQPAVARGAVRMSGGPTTMNEMISSTQRGLIVTRFSKVTTLDKDVPLGTGVTRDGLWLVENGKITKNVMNMRFTESPLFVFNQVDQLGTPVPVFHPEADWRKATLSPYIIPPIKANDFSFTSTIDAI